MNARLFCKSGQLAGAAFEVGAEATIGRAPDNDFVLEARGVSGHHARIVFDQARNHYALHDLKGEGIWLDGMPVEVEAVLEDFHVITIAGKYDFFFQRLAESHEKEAVDGKTQVSLAKPPMMPPGLGHVSEGDAGSEANRLSAGRTAAALPIGVSVPSFETPSKSKDEKPISECRFLLELELEDGLKSFPLAEGENTVGRSMDCNICVNHTTVSRKHATLIVHSGRVTLHDHGSLNRSKVENKPVEGQVPLEVGMRVQFGRVDGKLTTRE